MKKVLSIVLSLVMVLCMMPVMAFAGTTDEATGTSFSDASSITHSEAVYSLAALNIINGYTDGTYMPAKTVTRAEMCKMIATLYNGGTEPVLSTTTTSYTDTKGHWAAGYIEYCTSLGIVAGVGGGKFDPDSTVTAEQAAKMLLIAQGYNANVEGLVGDSWAANTNVLANQNDYYKELSDISTGAGLIREHAAQMIYNSLDAGVVAKSNSVNQATGEVITIYTPTEQSVANKYLSLQEKSAVLSAITYNEKDAEYEYTIGTKGENNAADIYKSSVNYTALFGQNVKVLYKIEKNKTVVYGMYADDSSVLYEGVWGDIDATTLKNKKVKIDGTEYKLDGTAIPTPIAEYTGESAASSVPAYSTIKVIDIDDDGDIDKITYSPVSVGEITFVGKTEFKFEGDATNMKFEDAITYDGMAKGDFAAKTTDLKTGDPAYAKLEVLQDAKVTSTKGATATVNGTTYDVLTGVTVSAGTTYDKLAILNGYIVAEKNDSTDIDLTKYALVSSEVKTTSSYEGDVESVKLLLTDGKEIEATLKSETTAPEKGTLVTFTTDSKDKYTLTEVTTKGKFDNRYVSDLTFHKKTSDDAANITVGDPVKNTYDIDSAAVVYVATTDSDGDITYSVISGTDLAAKTDVPTVNAIYTKKNKTTGYENVALALVGNTDVTDTVYAIVTDKSSEIKDEDGNFSYEVSLSTSDKVLTTKDFASTQNDIVALVKGDIVSYKINDEGKVVQIAKVSNLSVPSAVTAYDSTSGKIIISGIELKITEDTDILYIDSTTGDAVEGGSIQLAEEPTTGTFTPNVKYATVTDKNEISVIVVDVNNNMSK